MNIFLHELKTYWKSTLVWILSIAAGTAFLFSMFPAFAANAGALAGAMENYPVVIRLAFGIVLDQIGTVNGFFSVIVSFLAVVGAVQGMTLGMSLIGREKSGRTEEFLLTRPVSRVRIATAKLCAGAVLIALTMLAFSVAAAAGASLAPEGKLDAKLLAKQLLTFQIAQALFFGLGFAHSTLARRIRSVLPPSLSAVFALFAVGAVGQMLDLKPIAYLSPFRYVDPAQLITTRAVPMESLVAAAAVLCVLFAAGIATYSLRDVRA